MTYRGYRRTRSRLVLPLALAIGAVALVALLVAVVLTPTDRRQTPPPKLPASSTLTVVAPPVGEGTPRSAARKFAVTQRDQPFPGDLIPQPWMAWNARPASRSVELTWLGGCSDGYVLYVDERPSKVLIDVWERPATLEGDERCLAVGSTQSAVAKLAAPLGARRLLTHTVRPA